MTELFNILKPNNGKQAMKAGIDSENPTPKFNFALKTVGLKHSAISCWLRIPDTSFTVFPSSMKISFH